MLFLVDHRTNLAAREATKIWVENGIIVQRLASQEFGGEYRQNGLFYMTIVWVATVWSFFRNGAEALFRKVFISRDQSILEILWRMGRDEKHFSCFFGDRLSQYNHLAKTAAASSRVLDLFYNYEEKILPTLKNDLAGRATKFWIGRLENRQAVTNRLKIVIPSLVDAFKKVDESEIRLLSIASGSAIAVIRAMQKCPERKVKAVLIDIDEAAINEARQEAERAGLLDRFSFVNGSISVIEEVCKDFQPHIVEMCGFLDYRTKKQALRLIGRIKNILPEGGILVTCNINKNREQFFLTWLLLWPMIYRSCRQLGELLTGGGFEKEKTKLFYEPFEIHGVAVAVK